MCIDKNQLLNLIIRPSTKMCGWQSESSDILLLGTAELESNCGKYLRQIKGAALGIFQMEPLTHDSLIENELKSDQIKKIVFHSNLRDTKIDASLLVWNLYYASLMARAKYLTKKQPLPKKNDSLGMAEYYKLHYNTPLGASTIEKSKQVFEKIIKELIV